jgi:hypothetical protein
MFLPWVSVGSRVEVGRYLLVSQFERVIELRRPDGVLGPVPG